MINRIRRWIPSRAVRNYRWQFSKLYWSLYRLKQRVQFLLAKGSFGVRTRIRSGKESVSITWAISKAIIWPLLLAGLLSGALVAIDHLLFTYGGKALRLLASRPALDQNAHVELLSTLAQVAGAFLGLYFTAVSVVASTAYSRAPNDVRSLLLREKLGNLYIGVVAHLAALALILLGLNAFGLKQSVVPFVIVCMLGVASVYSFIVLGMRAFHFFNPVELSKTLLGDLVRLTRSATPDGFMWTDPSFQSHYQTQADRILKTFQSVLQLSLPKDGSSGVHTAELCSSLAAFCVYYSQLKVRIPSDSYWFSRVYSHRNWLTTDYNQIEMALQTGTAIRPEPLPDQMWLESRVAGIVTQAISASLAHGDNSTAHQVVDDLRKALRAISANCGIEEARYLLKAISEALQKEIEKTPQGVPKSVEEIERLIPSLALVEYQALCLTNIHLGLSDWLRETDNNSFDSLLSSLGRQGSRTSWQSPMPREVVKQAEYLALGIEAEMVIEGKEISPLWYRKQILVLGFLRFLSPTLKAIVDDLEFELLARAESLFSKKRPLHCAEIIEKGLETCHKALVTLRETRASLDRLATSRRVEDIPWPQPDCTALETKIGDIRTRFVILLAKLANPLSTLPDTDRCPDYFGQAYSVCATECFEALLNRKEKVFAELFPSVFRATFAAHSRLLTKLSEAQAQTRLALSTDPVIDVLDLSGYALIYSEVDSLAHWELVKKIWDEYFNGAKDPKATAEFIANIVEYRKVSIGLSPRAVLRTAWKIAFERDFRERKLLENEFYLLGQSEEETPRHPSKIIRALTRGGYLLTDAHDVFLSCYLLKRPEAAGIPLGRRGERFGEMLEREDEDEAPEGEA